jgi:hypothetical protein
MNIFGDTNVDIIFYKSLVKVEIDWLCKIRDGDLFWMERVVFLCEDDSYQDCNVQTHQVATRKIHVAIFFGVRTRVFLLQMQCMLFALTTPTSIALPD